MKNKHGGARTGSGRTDEGRHVRLCVRISQQAMDILTRRTTNKSLYIDKLIKKQDNDKHHS